MQEPRQFLLPARDLVRGKHDAGEDEINAASAAATTKRNALWIRWASASGGAAAA